MVSQIRGDEAHVRLVILSYNWNHAGSAQHDSELYRGNHSNQKLHQNTTVTSNLFFREQRNILSCFVEDFGLLIINKNMQDMHWKS